MTPNRGLTRQLINRFRAQSAPLRPMPTGVKSVLAPLPGIRAVLFDLYGTLLISAAGDIGALAPRASAIVMAEALAAAGIRIRSAKAPAWCATRFDPAIEKALGARRRAGCEHPEIDIAAVWRELLGEAAERGWIGQPVPTHAAEKLAVELECRWNPAWPMPGVKPLLRTLRARGLALGLVSNAQFYTPLLVEAVLGAGPQALGFRPDLCVWSFRHGTAKPSPALWSLAINRLRDRDGVEPGAILAVGNSEANDTAPAGALGCRTALFAGDARSLRRWPQNGAPLPRKPDAILTRLSQLPALLA